MINTLMYLVLFLCGGWGVGFLCPLFHSAHSHLVGQPDLAGLPPLQKPPSIGGRVWRPDLLRYLFKTRNHLGTSENVDLVWFSPRKNAISMEKARKDIINRKLAVPYFQTNPSISWSNWCSKVRGFPSRKWSTKGWQNSLSDANSS